jgi:hypothetical protein
VNSQQESSWLDGIIETEGSITTTKPKGKGRPSLSLTVEMADKDIIETFHKIVKTPKRIYYRNRKQKNSKWKDLFGSRVSGNNAENVLKRAYPYLYSRRKKEIDRALDFNLSHHSR